MSSPAAPLADAAALSRYEAVIGLEIHAQLATKTKIFCGCPAEFGAGPNSNVCPVCLGLPGALPVLNRRAVELAVRAAASLGCFIEERSVFARKNYFYPDLPKGYQISQYDRPLATRGAIEIRADGSAKRVGITRVHLEDDAGKSLHEGFPDSDRFTYVDLNRSGTPLIEIVTEPDLRSAAEAVACLETVKQILEFAGVSDCDMEKGNLRCDANVSVRPRGASVLGTRAEVKNLNSFRFLKAAVEYEIARQVRVLESGGQVVQETRLFHPGSGDTASMRSKEDAHDYRYFPEPDLTPLEISAAWREEILAGMPEPPASRRRRFREDYGLREYDAEVLTQSRALSDYYEAVAKASGDPKAAANWVMGDLAGLLNESGRSVADSPVSAERLGELVALIGRGEITNKLAKEILPRMFATGEGAPAIIEREGLKPIADAGALAQLVDEVIAANPRQVEQYRGGKTTVLGYFVGQAMRASRGQADPAVLTALLKEKL
jgi:aspartyl-tRNA(Asn)/glutamyl-tRNA(Gln) amidotransferase subunit B